jgi:hypothetical protein
MSTLEFLAITGAGAFALYFTFRLIRDVRAGKPFWRTLGKWIKNVIDSLFGAG